MGERRFPSNFIRTSKYTVYNYIPKALIIQFRRTANIYFLITAILQSIPAISPLNPISAIMPLVFILVVAIVREGIEDWARHKNDDKMNADSCMQIRGNGSREASTWAQIQVGDVLLLENNDIIPTDCILLSSSFNSGLCYIQTSSLDGEKNLKPKIALS